MVVLIILDVIAVGSSKTGRVNPYGGEPVLTLRAR